MPFESSSHEAPASDLALAAPGREERFQGGPVGRPDGIAIDLGGLDQDIEVADCSQESGQLAQPASIRSRPIGPVGVAEDAPGGSHPAGRHAHPVELLGIAAVARSRLPFEHPGQVEAEDLAAGFRVEVLGGHPGRLRRGQAHDGLVIRRLEDVLRAAAGLGSGRFGG